METGWKHEREVYEMLKKEVENDLKDVVENFTVKIIERGEVEKTNFKLCLAVFFGSAIGIRVKVENYFNPEKNAIDYTELFNFILSGLQFVQNEIGITESEMALDRSKIVITLVNENKYDLTNCPHRDFCGDIRIMYYSLVKAEYSKAEISVVIDNKMANTLGFANEEELYSFALENTRQRYPARLDDIMDVIKGQVGEERGAKEDDKELYGAHFFLQTGTACGAASILYPETMDMLRKTFKEDFYILPCVDKGLVVVPKSKANDLLIFRPLLSTMCKMYFDCYGNNLLSEKTLYCDINSGEFSVVE
ncbi:DUF5688 family protein [Coprococcus eutactus]|uniref:DUF5688 family protein n=1 Tax=Coprococcus eutactus TaxID=33043 RepID=UPI003219CE82